MATRFFALIIVIVFSVPAWAQGPPVEYTLSFPAPEHRWMQVEARRHGESFSLEFGT